MRLYFAIINAAPVPGPSGLASLAAWRAHMHARVAT